MSMPVSAAAVELPACVAFQSKRNGRYLRYMHEEDSRQAHKLLQMDGDDAVNPYTRFQVQRSELHEGLVHIRCCYNHKYWVARRLGDGGWRFLADADEPEEDLSKPSCTLIKLEPVTDDPTSVRLRHAQHGPMDEPADEQQDHLLDEVTVLTLPQKNLPEHVAFKSMANGKYLRARVIQRFNYLEFASEDIGDPDVRNQVVHMRDGTIRVRNTHFGMYWRLSPSWIWADAAASDLTDRTRFQVLQIEDYFALRNLGNRRFCISLTADRKTDCLNAAAETITSLARIQVEETVLSREIYNVQFRVGEARIYGNRVLVLFTETATNPASSESTKTVTLSYSHTQTSTWDSSLELKLGVTVKLSAGVPAVSEKGIEISTEFNSSYSWGKSEETTLTQEVSYNVPMPPRSKVTVRVIASEASCDVPFSYNQRDILTDGRVVNRVMHDGLYTGVNCFDIQTEIKEESL